MPGNKNITARKQARKNGAAEQPLDWRVDERGASNHLPDDAQNEASPPLAPADALIRSLANRGAVDIDYMAELCGLSRAEVIAELGQAIWQNPETWGGTLYYGWETADQYFSGPLTRKLAIARARAEKYPSLFQRNVQALEAMAPAALVGAEIHMALGAPWIPAEIIEKFLNWLFEPVCVICVVLHDETGGRWRIKRSFNYKPGDTLTGFRLYGNTRALYRTYGTKSCDGIELLEKTLNRLQIKKTSLAEKQKKLERAFQKWLRTNPEIREKLQSVYAGKFGNVRKRAYDGSFLKFPGMNPAISLFPHQRNAVARILFSGSALLAHKVGAGKTYTMIAAAMELKRLGRSRKNIFIVPNNVAGQWREAFGELYPDANVLLVQSGDFTPKNRVATLEKIRDLNYDGIIIAYSCAERIPLSLQYRLDALESKKNAILEEARALELEGTGEVNSRLNKLEREIEKQRQSEDIPDELCFDRLGISGFFLDEAHNYKNIPLDTKLAYVRGINAKGSQKCANMLARCQAVRAADGIAVLATGTPVCNSITDVYTMQKFLQNETLSMFSLGSFDSWAANFAEIREVLELDVDGGRFRNVERFARFHNLPELSAIFNMIADYAVEINWAGVAECEERENITIPNSPQLVEYVQGLARRADLVHAGKVDATEDNMLKITTDGRKAALDMTLVGVPNPPKECKAAFCAQKVAEIWRETAAERCAQVVFCDLSVPKEGFNVYSKLKALLIEQGIPASEIAFVHDSVSPAQKEKLYAKVRKGAVRVILGSTFKLGLGVNIQDRLVALHHLDAPWRPADMVQREGRILRRGNMHQYVRIFRYVTEGSFDAYCWQILETKQRFIANFLGGSLGSRQGAELDSHILSYAEVKALALGEPLIRERVECAGKIEKLIFLQRTWEEEREKMRMEIVAVLGQISDLEKKITHLKEDRKTALANPPNLDQSGKEELGSFLLFNMDLGTGGAVEKTLDSYRGFELVLRANPASAERGLWVKGRFAAFVPAGKSAPGFITRLDNYLKGLAAAVRKSGEELEALRKRIEDLNEELKEPDPYASKLAALNRKLKKLDQKLEEK